MNLLKRLLHLLSFKKRREEKRKQKRALKMFKQILQRHNNNKYKELIEELKKQETRPEDCVTEHCPWDEWRNTEK